MLKDGLGRISFLLPALVGCFVVVAEGTGPNPWTGDPQDTLLFLSVYAYGLAGGLAVLTSGIAGRRQRARLDAGRDLPVVALWRVLVRGVARPLALNLTSFAVVWTSAELLGSAASGGLPALPPLALVALPIVSIGLCVVVGYSTGLLVEAFLVLVPLAGVPYLTLELAGQSRGAWWSVLPFIDEDWDPGRRARSGLLAAFELGWVLFAIALLSACVAMLSPAWNSRSRLARPSAAVIAGVTAVGLLSTSSARGAGFSTADRARPICVVERHDRLCLWRQRQHLLPAYRLALQRVAAALASIDEHGWDFAETDLPSPTYDVALPTVDAQPGVSELIQEMVQGVVAAIGDPRCGGDALTTFERTEVFSGLLQRSLGMPVTLDGLQPGSQQTLSRLLTAPAAEVVRWGTAADDARCRTS